MPALVTRLVAAAAGLVLAWATVVGALFTLLFAGYAGQRPSPASPPNDPWGGPETWEEVAGAAAVSVPASALTGLVLAAAFLLARFAITGREATTADVLWIAGAVVMADVVGIAGGLAVG